ncbi:MAG: hypothetical protein M0035_04350 [Actinomycetota bacterium]|nr:hypothetical protein [Actinomycetota bacterium]
MVFVEVFRLLLVLAGAIAGLQVGEAAGPTSADRVVGLVLGALVTYVIGGIAGRLLDRGIQQGVHRMRRMPPGEVFAASVVGTVGLLLGLVAGLPLLALVHSSVDYPLVAAFAWVAAAVGIRLGIAKGRQIIRAAGMTRLLDPPDEPPPSGALVADTSAILDRSMLAIGAAGLLPAGIVVPRFVLDEARLLADSPDPVASRRARRGLEALDALAAAGVEVRHTDDEVPEHELTRDKVLALARRLGTRIVTCSAEQATTARDAGVDVLDLRHLAAALTPDHPAGEHLVIDLLKEGRQPGQAVGYLPEGDMVVVNEAAHLVGRQGVEVAVISTRQTAQGLLVFARLLSEASSPGSTQASSQGPTRDPSELRRFPPRQPA